MDHTATPETVAHHADRSAPVGPALLDIMSFLIRTQTQDPVEAITHVCAALARLGRFDAVHVFLRKANGKTEMFCAQSLPETPEPRPLPENVLQIWLEALLADQTIAIPDTATLPACSAEGSYLQSEALKACIVIPMMAAGHLWGFLRLDNIGPLVVTDQEDHGHIKLIADALGAVLARIDTAAAMDRMRNSLTEAHNRLHATLNAQPDLILEVDAAGRYRSVHTADPHQMMVPPDTLIGKTDAEVMPVEIAELNRRAMDEAARLGRSGPHPFDIETPRGKRRYSLTVSPRPAETSDEKPGFVFVARDITQEWRLQRETERLSLLGRYMTNLVIMADTEQRIEWVNSAFEERTGWTLEEVRGRRPQEVSRGPETDASTAEQIDTALSKLGAVRREIVNYARDGSTYWVDAQIFPIFESCGQHTGYVSIETDITLRKQQDAELERLAQDANNARARLEMAVEALPDGFAYYDADERLVLCNERYKACYPDAADRMRPGTHVAEIFHTRPAHHAGVGENAFSEAWQDGNRWMRIVERTTPDGGRVGMHIDVTELKNAEQRLSAIIDAAELGTWEWTLSTGENLINARWAEIVGYSLHELSPLTIEVWRKLVHPDDLLAADKLLQGVLSGTGGQFEYELRMRHKEGHWVWVISRGRVIQRAPDGTPEVMAGVHIDISALKRAEQRLGDIIDASSAGTWELDLETSVKHVNERWAKMLGYTRSELAGLPNFGFKTLIHPDDLEILEQQHSQVLARGADGFANEIRMRHRDGHWVWILSRGRVVARDDAGKPLRVAGIHLDISERKQLESDLTTERDYLAGLMDTSASGIVAMDDDGRIIFANREAERILGMAATELTGMRYDAASWQIAALDGSVLPKEELPFARAYAGGQTVRDIRFAIVRPDGIKRMLSVNAAPINSAQQKGRVVVSINDITEQVEAENELRAAVTRAEAANQAKSRFLANMSHEIRTPLNGILGMSQILADELTDRQHLQMLDVVQESGELLLTVLNDVLDMSKIEAGKLALESVSFLPSDLVQRIDMMHRPFASDKGLQFDIQISAAARQERLGDPSRLSQILHNLVGNAIKFTETGHVTLRLEAADCGAFRIVVQDSGIGMTPEQQARIFEDFEQADGTMTRRFGGTGLGMSIVRKLVHLMQGEITLHSSAGHGTEVCITLPLPLGTAMSESTPQRQETPTRTKIRVLAADDNKTNRMVLQAMLKSFEAEVVLAEDGREAVDAWAPDRFDVILLDISMPELDGMRALAEIRNRETAAGVPPVPAIAITANAMTHQVTEYLQNGFAAHIGKPFKRDVFRTVLEDTLAADTRALKED
ncbi:MAG: PAS domain S-box protein [Roseinatronobacter sp.]